MTAIKGILFDLYGTLVDIETDESLEEIYRGIAHYLTYQGIFLHRDEVRDRYWEILRAQKDRNPEEFPEIDVLAIWNAFLRQKGVRHPARRTRLSLTLAQLFRGISRKRLRLYPGVGEVLDRLCGAYRLGIVSDAQPCFALPEMQALGLQGRFDSVVISGDCGFRKPDPRIFQQALEAMELGPWEVLFVGNDMYRDIHGASRLGIRTLFVDSNQGVKVHGDVRPDYVIRKFEEVLQGVAFLSDWPAEGPAPPSGRRGHHRDIKEEP